MEDQYGIPDLRHFVAAGRPFLPPASPPPFPHRSLTTDNLPYYMLNFRSDPSAPAFEPEASGGAGRWPRQETLTLLEIRSRLDAKFKEANQKGPLWDEVSRIMSEEYGYHRSGKKCREKFENLYKYYKKTKAGKSSRQDGKHYRFFRQLEALYGGDDHQTLNNNNQESSNPTLVSISTSSDFDAFVSSDDDSDEGKTRRKSLKEKIKESIDSRMKEMMEKQEAWMEKMMRTIEANEQERLAREEQWRRKDVERIEREQRMWAGEKAWIQARDAALMDALTKMVGKEDQGSSRMGPSHHHHHHQNDRESISEQGIDGSSPPDYNAMGDGGFRYFGGDGYGGL